MNTTEAIALLHLPHLARDGDCIRVAPKLAEMLGGEVVAVWGWIDPVARLLGFMHLAVRFDGGLVLDATATQFDASLPMPLLTPQADYCKLLAGVTGVAYVTITATGWSQNPSPQRTTL